MTKIDLTLELPDQVAAQAVAANLLTPEAISALIQQELLRQRDVAQLFDALDRLDAVNLPPLTDSRSRDKQRPPCASFLIPTQSSLLSCGTDRHTRY